MTFHMDIIKECFPTWVHLRILETLVRRPQAMSQRQLARVMGIPRATAQRALNDLGQTGLIKSHRVGSANYWEMDREHGLYEILGPILDGLEALTPPLHYLKTLIRKVVKLPKSYRCMIFGSTSHGSDQPFSDIDIAIILPGGLGFPPPSLTKDLETLQDLCREKFGKRLAPIFVNEKDLKNQNKELYRNILKGMEIEP